VRVPPEVVFMSRIPAILAILSFISLTACGGGGGAPADTTDTDTGPGNTSKTSHNAGQDCLSCHKVGGTAESAAVFSTAGTIYKSNGSVQANATVNFYITGTNTLTGSFKTDDSGNFYTEVFVDGLYYGTPGVTGVDIEVQGPSGLRTMPGIVSNGSCGTCHGKSNGNIVAN